MKKKLLLLITIAFTACSTPDKPLEETEHFYAPPAGTVIAADSMKIKEDQLNKLYYSARIVSTDSSNKGSYTLDAAFGFNEAISEVKYPALQRKIFPALRTDTAHRYSYILGFTYDGSDTFHDYAQITAVDEEMIKFKYIRSYYIDSVKAK